MLLGRDITEHGRALPPYLGRPDGTGDVVVARRNVGHERAERVERCTVTLRYLPVHVGPYLLHRHMSGAFNEHLHVFGPRPFHEFAHGVEFGKLRRVVGIKRATGPQPITQRDGRIVAGADVADVVEAGVEETLLVVYHAPLGDDASAAAHHPRETTVGQRHILPPDAAVYREVVHPLLALLDERVAEHLPREPFDPAAHLLEGLIHRHRAHRHRTVAQYPLTGFVYVRTRGEIHERVSAPLAAPHGLLHLLADARRGG